MTYSAPIITTLVTKSQPENHQAGVLQDRNFGDTRRMIKNRLLELRTHKGWSLAALQEITGISAQHLNRLETHHPKARLNEDNIAVLCSAYHVSVSELFESDNKKGADVAIVFTLKAIIKVLLHKKQPITHERFINDFTFALDRYRDENAPGAIEVIVDLLEYVKETSSPKSSQNPRKILRLSPPG